MSPGDGIAILTRDRISLRIALEADFGYPMAWKILDSLSRNFPSYAIWQEFDLDRLRQTIVNEECVRRHHPMSLILRPGTSRNYRHENACQRYAFQAGHFVYLSAFLSG